MRRLKGRAWIIFVSGLVLLSLYSACQPITSAGYLGLLKSGIVERNITYETADGIELKMDIFYHRKTEEPRPAIVYIHGGGWYSGDKSRGAGQYDIPELVAHGYVVASVNYRLAPRYKFPAQIEDIKCAIRFLRANADKYGIDSLNIGVLGDSAGGHLAALAGVTDVSAGFGIRGEHLEQTDAVQAVVDMYGPADLALICQTDHTGHMEHVFGTDDPESMVIKRASPITYVSIDDPPFLILHGDQDNEVLPEQSRVLYQKLSITGVPAILVTVHNSGHRFESADDNIISPTRAEITEIILDFLDKHLKKDA
ncbi:MAG: alpha/beta hydrolase [Chloroflexota bacterium]